MKKIFSAVLGLSLTLATAGLTFAAQAPATTAPAASTAKMAKKHVKKTKKAKTSASTPAATPAAK